MLYFVRSKTRLSIWAKCVHGNVMCKGCPNLGFIRSQRQKRADLTVVFVFHDPAPLYEDWSLMADAELELA